MDGIRGSTNALINRDVAMSNIRLKSELPSNTLKKGLDVQVQNAMSLNESIQVPYPRLTSSPTGWEVDSVA